MLPPVLWSEASKVQEREVRALTSPWTEKLEVVLEGRRGEIEVDDVYRFLGLEMGRQNTWTAATVRKSFIKEQLGWKKKTRRAKG